MDVIVNHSIFMGLLENQEIPGMNLFIIITIKRFSPGIS